MAKITKATISERAIGSKTFMDDGRFIPFMVWIIEHESGQIDILYDDKVYEHSENLVQYLDF